MIFRRHRHSAAGRHFFSSCVSDVLRCCTDDRDATHGVRVPGARRRLHRTGEDRRESREERRYLARIGENLAINENVSFEDEFRQLEDDHEAVFVLRTVSQLTTTRIQSSCRCTVK